MNPALVLFTGIFTLIAYDAYAQDSAKTKVTISPEDCQRLVQYRPSADVAYKPGVDVNGKPVAPADLPGSARITAPNEITIDLSVDFLRQYGVATDSLLSPRGEASVGTVKYDISSGKLTYNGQSLTDPEQEALAAACSSPKKK